MDNLVHSLFFESRMLCAELRTRRERMSASREDLARVIWESKAAAAERWAENVRKDNLG